MHISATTLSFLNGEFEVEAAFGEKRDESLRIAGLKTYFIVRVLKPVKSTFLGGFVILNRINVPIFSSSPSKRCITAVGSYRRRTAAS